MKKLGVESIKTLYKLATLVSVSMGILLLSMTSYAGLSVSTLKAEEVPAYSGTPYVEIAENIPSFSLSDLVTDEYVSFGALDSLGRTTGSSACLGLGTIPTTSRSAIGTEIRPSGFQLDKYPDLIESPAYLYNRCHVIGYQLCGDNGSPQNLFTGTRYLNATGMLPFESQVASCIEGTGYHVIYGATPIYRGDNLVADGIQLEAYSVEDNGKFVKFNVFVYNVQPGVLIDYATGKSKADPNYIPSVSTGVSSSYIPLETNTEVNNKKSAVTRSKEQASTDTANADYILNTNTKKFHYPWCSSVSDMKEKNKKVFNGSRDEAIGLGYVPCKRCKP